MKKVKVIVQIGVGLLLAFLIMWYQGLFVVTKLSDIIMAIADGFTVVAVLYLGIGSLMWISSTGFFDIFGFAVKRGLHAILPGMIQECEGNYYEYKVQKNEKRKGFTEHLTLKLGLVFLVISIILTAVWYAVA